MLIALLFSILARTITKRVHASLAGLSDQASKGGKGKWRKANSETPVPAADTVNHAEPTIDASNFTDRFHTDKEKE